GIAIVSLQLSARANIDQAKTRAAEFSLQVWDRFRADDVQSAFLDVEWSRFEYPRTTHNGFKNDDEERRIDRLLYLLDDVASLAQSGILSTSDASRWSYIVVRVFDAAPMRRYMEFLENFYRTNGIESGPHLLAWRWYHSIRPNSAARVA